MPRYAALIVLHQKLLPTVPTSCARAAGESLDVSRSFLSKKAVASLKTIAKQVKATARKRIATSPATSDQRVAS